MLSLLFKDYLCEHIFSVNTIKYPSATSSQTRSLALLHSRGGMFTAKPNVPLCAYPKGKNTSTLL